MRLSGPHVALIERLRNISHLEVKSALLDSLLDDLHEPDPAPPEPPWKPKVGDTVILTDGITGDSYKVVAIRGRECKLSHDGVLQTGWFGFDSLAPAPPEASWKPNPGDRVRLKNVPGSSTYDVLSVDGDRVRLSFDGLAATPCTMSQLEPAPPDPAEPTADQMLDWLEENGREAVVERDETWTVRDSVSLDDVVSGYDTIRDAIRAAMKQEGD